MVRAAAQAMAAHRHQDLIVWQLANRLAIEVVRLTDSVELREDRRICDQVRTAARSVPANIAEGFARYTPADFARFLRYARGSIAETQAYLDHIESARLLPPERLAPARTLSARVGAALTSLLRYLLQADADRHAPQRK